MRFGLVLLRLCCLILFMSAGAALRIFVLVIVGDILLCCWLCWNTCGVTGRRKWYVEVTARESCIRSSINIAEFYLVRPHQMHSVLHTVSKRLMSLFLFSIPAVCDWIIRLRVSITINNRGTGRNLMSNALKLCFWRLNLHCKVVCCALQLEVRDTARNFQGHCLSYVLVPRVTSFGAELCLKKVTHLRSGYLYWWLVVAIYTFFFLVVFSRKKLT